MVESVKFLSLIYSEYVRWLEDNSDRYQAEKYISHVKSKQGNYDQFLIDKRKSLIDELPRSIRRYQDEFYFKRDFRAQSDHYLDDLEVATKMFFKYYSNHSL
jgi:hypothetical protein